MNYIEIKETALAYSDKEGDTVIASKLDNFLRIVESRVNRVLKVQKMSTVDTIPTSESQQYYDLPQGFAGLRDVSIKSAGTESTKKSSLSYVSPEQMNIHTTTGNRTKVYTIITGRIQISPPQDNKILELIYYLKLAGLTPEDDTNWLSEDAPDVYIYGLMVEISAFVKNASATNLWDTRFKEALGEIEMDDSMVRWSGTSLTTRAGQ